MPFGGWAIVATLVGGTLATCVAGALLGRAPPEGFGDGRGSPTLDLLTMAAGIALIGLLLEALFRSARLQSLQAYDAWAFWVPKGKAIFFFDGLDEQIFTSLPGPTYPPLVPILDAAAFHAMGGVDTVTFHLQYWFLLLGAVAAIAGCLHRRVAAWLLWPSLVLVLVASALRGAAADTAGGRPRRRPVRGRRPAARVVARGRRGLATRRGRGAPRRRDAHEARGPALRGGGARGRARRLACLEDARSRAAPARGARGARRRRPVAPLVPEPFDRRRGADDAGVGGSFDRVVDSLRLSFDVLFDSGLWSIAPVVAIVALTAAAVWGDRRVAAFLGALLGIVFVGGAWVTYSFVDIPITDVESVNPIVRYTGAIVLLAVVSTPLLLDSVWRGRGSGP